MIELNGSYGWCSWDHMIKIHVLGSLPSFQMTESTSTHPTSVFPPALLALDSVPAHATVTFLTAPNCPSLFFWFPCWQDTPGWRSGSSSARLFWRGSRVGNGVVVEWKIAKFAGGGAERECMGSRSRGACGKVGIMQGYCLMMVYSDLLITTTKTARTAIAK